MSLCIVARCARTGNLGVGIASGLAPAIQASRMEPVEALNT